VTVTPTAKRNPKRKSNPERKLWRQRRDLFIDLFGSVGATARKIGCHPNALRILDTCPEVKRKVEAALAKRGEVLP